jgi:hypothetical protein
MSTPYKSKRKRSTGKGIARSYPRDRSKKSTLRRDPVCLGENSHMGICIGMLSKAKKLKIKRTGKKYHRKFLQILVNLLKRNYNWHTAMTMTRYFNIKELNKKINPMFNSRDINGDITSEKRIRIPTVTGRKPKGRKRRIKVR